MAVARDAAVLARVRARAESEPWPAEDRVNNRLKLGAAQRTFSRPGIFTMTAFPALLAASLYKARPDVYLWEKIRPLAPMPDSYRGAIHERAGRTGACGVSTTWMPGRPRRAAHAGLMDAALSGLPGVHVPYVPADVEHVYYQYCVYAPDRDSLVRRALRHGVDVETLHVDVCSTLPLFGEHPRTPNAEAASQVVQLPVYASLSDRHARLVATKMRRLLETDQHSTVWR